ncbi:MAG TPA: TadE/TadG family type IV pilus assembly protein [Bauldia sp.]|nr:TadE/TadG family type IV pilus assembly protein [Bauldia sp.]
MVSLARLSRIWRFRRDQAGVSAVEFALILPLMLALFFGGAELSDALTINRKVSHVTSALSDLVTQSKSLSDADMSNILDAASAVITPYSTSNLKIKVTQIKIDATSKATVSWSDARNDTPLTVGATVTTIPSALLVANSYLIMTEVHYSYKPTIGYVMTGTFDLTDKFYLRPRVSDFVART